MALETSGFQLSQFDRAPSVPGNVGVVDTKGIYGAVVDALKAHEALRTTQQMQATTDAELAYQQKKAQTEMGLLGPEAEARQAKANLFSAAAPYQMGQLGLQSQADESKLRADIARNKLLAQDDIARQSVLGKFQTPYEKEIQNLAPLLQDPNTPQEVRNAILTRMRVLQDANTAAKNAVTMAQTKPVTLADGSVVSVPTHSAIEAAPAGQPVFGGAITPTGQQAFGAPASGLLNSAPTGMPTKLGVQGQLLGQKSRITSAAKYGTETGTPLDLIQGDQAKEHFIKMNVERVASAEKALDTQQTNLTNFYNVEAPKEDAQVERLNRLIKGVSENKMAVTGGGKIGDMYRKVMPGTSATFESEIAAVGARLQLANMLRLKNASATGATGFGSLTEPEGELLRADFGALNKRDMSADDMVALLTRVRDGTIENKAAAFSIIQQQMDTAKARAWRAATAYLPPDVAAKTLGFSLAQPQAEEAPERIDAAEAFPPAPSMAPEGLESKASASGPHTEGPLVPAEGESQFEVTEGGQGREAAAAASGFKIVNPASGSAAPAAAPAGLTNLPAPVKSSDAARQPEQARTSGAAQPVGAKEVGQLVAMPGLVTDEVGKRLTAAVKGFMSGDYSVPEKGLLEMTGEKIGEAISGENVTQMRERFRKEDEILKKSPNSRAAYDIRRDLGRPGPAKSGPGYTRPMTGEEEDARNARPAKTEEKAPEPAKTEAKTGPVDSPADRSKLFAQKVPEMPVSKSTKDFMRQVYEEYESREKGAPPPMLTITAADGTVKKSLPLDNPSIWSILTNPENLSERIRGDSVKGGQDILATRRLMDTRMQRLEQLRALEAMRPPTRGR